MAKRKYVQVKHLYEVEREMAALIKDADRRHRKAARLTKTGNGNLENHENDAFFYLGKGSGLRRAAHKLKLLRRYMSA